MHVRDVMPATVITVGPKALLPEALRLLRERGIRHLPVVEDGQLVGIVSDRDLKQALAGPAAFLVERLPGADIMTPRVFTTAPDLPVEDAARVMVGKKISAEGRGVAISSIVSLTAAGGGREVVLRLATIHPARALRALEAGGFRVRNTWPRDGAERSDP